MGRVKAVPRDVVKVVTKGVSNKKKVFTDNDDDNDENIDEKVDIKMVSKKGKKAVEKEASSNVVTAKKEAKKGEKAVDDEAPEEISTKDNDDIRRLKEWHESLVTGNSKTKKRKAKKETSVKVDPSAALDLSVLEAYTQYNDANISDDASDDIEASGKQDSRKKIDKTARSKQVGNLQVTYIDPKSNDPFAVYKVSSSALEFTKVIKDQQPRVSYAVFRAQKRGGPSKVFKR